jgi:lambda family phage tail tape measure protein
MAQGVTVDFNANVARFTTAVDKMTNDLTKFQTHAERVSKNIKAAFNLLGVGLTTAGLVEFVQGAVEAADHLGNLAAATHLTVTELAGLKLAAKESGSDLDSVALQIERLTVNMGKSADKFARIGIDAKSPLEAFKQLADVMVGIKDPQERAAVGAVAMGRNWATAAPLLLQGSAAIAELVDQGIRLSANTEKMVRLSKEFNDAEDELQASLEDLRNKGLIPLLPELTLTTQYITDASESAKNATGFSALKVVVQALAVLLSNFAFTWEVLGMRISEAKEMIHILATGGSIDDILKLKKTFTDAIAEMRKELEKFNYDILNPPSPSGGAPKPPPVGKNVPQSALASFIGGPDFKQESAVAKKALDNYIKLLEDAAKNEQQILADYNKTLDYYYGEDLISIQDYYAARNAAAESATTRMIGNYNKELDALQKFTERADITDLDRITTQGKINDVLEKQNDILYSTSATQEQNVLMQKKAYKELQNSLSSLSVEYLNMNYQLGVAAAKEFDLTNQQLKARLEAENNTEALKELAAIRQRTIEQASTEGEAGFARSIRDYVNMTRDAGKQIEELVTTSFKSMEDALTEFVQKGSADFHKLADSIIADMIRIAVQQSITGPLASLFGGLFGGGSINGIVGGSGSYAAGFTANGAIFDGFNRFASGGIVTQPTLFGYADGGKFNAGLMGESGPEAVMPLARDSSGKLGVRSQGGMSVTYAPVIQIDSRTDRSDVERLVLRAVKQGNVDLVDKLQRQRRL